MNAKRTSAKAKGKRRVVFEAQAPMGAMVFVAGSFNAWDSTAKPMVDKDDTGYFTATCMLMPGSYEYKLIVDGEWTVDPQNPSFVVNSMGTLNSLLEVS